MNGITSICRRVLCFLFKNGVKDNDDDDEYKDSDDT